MNKEELVKKLELCFRDVIVDEFGFLECHIGNGVFLLVMFDDTTTRILVKQSRFRDAILEYVISYESMEDVLDNVESALRKYLQLVRWQTVFSSEIVEKLESVNESEAVREYVASLGEKKLERMQEVCDAAKRDWLIKRGFPT